MPRDKNAFKIQRPIFEHFIIRIYKTGLLLDEDIELLLEKAHIEFDRKNFKISYGGPIIECIVGGGALALAFIFLRQKLYNSFFTMTAIASTPLILSGLNKIFLIHTLAIQENKLEKVLHILNNMAKINRMVLEFLKLRDAESKRLVIFEPYTRSIRELMEVVCMQEVNLFITMQDAVKYIGTFVPCVNLFYSYVDSMKFDSYNFNTINDIEDCINMQEKILNCCILLTSNCLTSLGISMCPSFWTNSNDNLDKVLNEIIPNLLKVLTECYNEVNTKFDNAKYYSFNKRNSRKPVKPSKNNSNKLKVVTYDCLIRTNDIVEKCRHILDRVENVETLDLANRQLLRDGIDNLCQNVFGCYEHLDLLLKSYEVSVLAEKPKGSQVLTVKQDIDPEPIQVIQHLPEDEYDEKSSDDEFEAYTGTAVEPQASESSRTFVVEDDSNHFMTLLDKELKHALRTHSRFAAARTRRGIIDEGILSGSSRAEAPQVGKFAADGEGVNHITPPAPPPTPPPPPSVKQPPAPPPLPVVSVEDDANLRGDNFSDAIKSAFRNRPTVEEVFEFTDN